jgi:hypothetical protein
MTPPHNLSALTRRKKKKRKRKGEDNTSQSVVSNEQSGCVKTLQLKNPVGKKGLKGKLLLHPLSYLGVVHSLVLYSDLSVLTGLSLELATI